VRALIPAAAPGKDMYDITTCHVDYSRLDRSSNQTCIRLNSTAVTVRNVDGGVDVGYVRGGRLERVAARHCVMAGWGMMSAMICPELPEVQRAAMRMNVKLPLVYNKGLIRNWQAFADAGVYEIGAPMAFHSRVMLDYPVSIGSYRSPSHCHGDEVNDTGSFAPDLRESVLATNLEAFESVLHQGTRAALGMPKFDDLSDEELRAIYMYIRQRAREASHNTK
jgi:hypothetical protein